MPSLLIARIRDALTRNEARIFACTWRLQQLLPIEARTAAIPSAPSAPEACRHLLLVRAALARSSSTVRPLDVTPAPASPTLERQLMRPRLPLAARRALLLAAVALTLGPAACAAPAPAPTTPPAPAITAAPAPGAATLTPAQIAARSTPAIVSIRSAHGLGTGFVVRKDGWIATNLHVIMGARALVVATPDGHEYPVLDVLAVDRARDLAILRVDASDLRVLALGDSDAVRAGDTIVAIGHPLGLEDTVSNGLVSAVRVIDPALTVLQISAPIAPGSSGGPLFSDKGEVVGVARAFSTEGQNLNFGVPVRYLKALMEDPHAVPLAVFAAATGPSEPTLPRIQRTVPVHELGFLAGCADDDLERAGRIIAEAIDVGAPVYNEQHFAACYHIYEGAALDVEKRMPVACKGPRKAMRDGRTRAQKLDDPSAQAWAMRDAFDGLLEVMARKLGASGKRRR